MSNRANKKLPGTSKRKFTQEEDRILTEAVAQFGAEKWSFIASFLENRNMRQVRERYMNYLRPNLDSSPLTLEELKLLADMIKKHGNDFAAISKIFVGRTAIFLKNQSVNLDKKIEKLEKSIRLLEGRATSTIAPEYIRSNNVVFEVPPNVDKKETTDDEIEIEYDTEIKENEECKEKNDIASETSYTQSDDEEESTDIEQVIDAAFPDHLVFFS